MKRERTDLLEDFVLVVLRHDGGECDSISCSESMYVGLMSE